MNTVYSTVLGKDVEIVSNPKSSSPFDPGMARINRAEQLILSLHGGLLGNDIIVNLPRDTISLHA